MHHGSPSGRRRRMSRTHDTQVCQGKYRHLKASQKPVRWVSTGAVSFAQFETILGAGITNWVWNIQGTLKEHKGMIAAIRRQLAQQDAWPDQTHIRFHWILEHPVSLRKPIVGWALHILWVSAKFGFPKAACRPRFGKPVQCVIQTWM